VHACRWVVVLLQKLWTNKVQLTLFSKRLFFTSIFVLLKALKFPKVRHVHWQMTRENKPPFDGIPRYSLSNNCTRITGIAESDNCCYIFCWRLGSIHVVCCNRVHRRFYIPASASVDVVTTSAVVVRNLGGGISSVVVSIVLRAVSRTHANCLQFPRNKSNGVRFYKCKQVSATIRYEMLF